MENKYKVQITLSDISGYDYDIIIENIKEYLSNIGIEYNIDYDIGIGEEE